MKKQIAAVVLLCLALATGAFAARVRHRCPVSW